ncbi:hypothetical protein GGR95_002937 [Sulfitobacter undariae]|uniref:Uncharacterized protein n=1 Tax=Sulfitobacter undariae TaxID=1563671 RepID=A0A7W6H1J9_9RHOB|nr:hypothetical protein [Sulfitobacter undariae]
MTNFILLIVFAGAMSTFGSTQVHKDLTKEQCEAMLTWAANGIGRSADAMCEGPNGDKITIKRK